MVYSSSDFVITNNHNKIIQDGGMTSISSQQFIVINTQLPKTGEKIFSQETFILIGLILLTICIIIKNKQLIFKDS